METSRVARDFLTKGLRVVGLLAFAHLWMALHIALAIGPVVAMVYMLFPPLIAVYCLQHFIAEFPLFSAWIAGTYLLSAVTILATCGRRFRRIPAIRPVICLPFFVVWLPVFSAELIRAVAMHSAIMAAGPECYETSSFMTSLHDRNEYTQAHAWMIKDGKRYIWSYGELRFVADSRPIGNGGNCRWKRHGIVHKASP
ncbi:MAG: hypothetical protein M3R16_12020 [Pseudomonadota bacterium]|nr:hypothetical protein [Pseudomonadota bacterium]